MRRAGGFLGALAWIIAATFHSASTQAEQGADEGPRQLPRFVAGLEQEAAVPFLTLRVHDINNIGMTVTNWGTFGSYAGRLRDPMTGLPAPSLEFPPQSSIDHLDFAALWVGGWKDSEIRTSTADDGVEGIAEFLPAYDGRGDMRERSIRTGSPLYDPDARAEQEFVTTFTDTTTNSGLIVTDTWTPRPHAPLGVEVRQTSYAWSYEYARDFIIMEYWIKNIGDGPIVEMYAGVHYDPMVNHPTNRRGYFDDILGLRRSTPSIAGWGIVDTIDVAWFADNEGDTRRRREFRQHSPLSVVGMSYVGLPYRFSNCGSDSIEYSFNWWAGSGAAAVGANTGFSFDWGPQHKPGYTSPAGGHGVPLGDWLKYRYMANGELDYDQTQANINYKDSTSLAAPSGWILRDGGSWFTSSVSAGYNTKGLISVGPFDLEVGDSIPIALAVGVGDHFHKIAVNMRNLRVRPNEFYANLNFKDLMKNMQWAGWVYDNPGIDTDGDGCAGKFLVTNCRDTAFYNQFFVPFNCDSIYYGGDGVPDLEGPPPPPSPEIQVSTEPGSIRITWSGRLSEVIYDNFSNRNDFEGYKVYWGVGNTGTGLSMVASWDIQNYNRFELFEHEDDPEKGVWINNNPPFTIDSLRGLYGDDFKPDRYGDPLNFFTDRRYKRFYFIPQGGNRGNTYDDGYDIVTNPIQRIAVDSVYDDRGFWRYFGSYEYSVTGLLESQPYNVAVTAFDNGSAINNLDPQESIVQDNLVYVYPVYSPDNVDETNLDIGVYPNPYKISAVYRERGFEDPLREGFVERSRRIHFVNLPAECTIRIHSLDGDLIREINHPDPFLSDTDSHVAWDIITRNTQAITSGIYFWSVESEKGTQVGKIVVIK